MPNPPVEAKELLLRVEELPPEKFERFALALAEMELEGDGRLYGRRGERQDGVDFLVNDADGGLHVGQARRVRSLMAHHLRRLVDEFLDGPWGPQASSYILCTTADLRTAATVRELERQRVRLLDGGIRLHAWDRERMSTMLRKRPALVEQFFGRDWVERFCLVDTGPGLLDLLTPGIVRVEDASWRDLGVHPAVLHAADGLSSKIPRRVDDQVRDALDGMSGHPGPGMLVLRGESAAGKSRAAYDGLRAEMPRAWLLAPRSIDALAGCLDPTTVKAAWRRPGPLILWLDDLEQFVGSGGAGLAWPHVRRLETLGQPVVIVATLGGKGALRVSEAERSMLHIPLDTLLAQADPVVIDVPRSLVDDEIARKAVEREFGLDALAEVERFGFGAYLIAAERLMSKLNTAKHDLGSPPCSEGRELAWAVLDWHTAGLVEPMPLETAHALWSERLHGRAVTQGRWDRALEWATEPVVSEVTLIQARSGAGLIAHDYVARTTERARTGPLERTVWETILRLHPEHSYSLALKAAQEVESVPVAEQPELVQRALTAWEVDRSAGDAEAALNQALLLQSQHRIPEAQHAFEAAIELGSGDGHFYLADLLNDLGDHQQALEHYLSAARLYSEEGLLEASIGAYGRAVTIDAARAAFELVDQLEELELDEYWRNDIHGQRIPWTTVAFALQQVGLNETADWAFRQQLHDVADPDSLREYWDYLLESGHTAVLERSLRSALRDGTETVGLEASERLVSLLLTLGRQDEALRALLPDSSGDELAADLELVAILYDEDRITEARELLASVARRGHRPAWAQLGLFAARSGDEHGAAEAFSLATERDIEDAALTAEINGDYDAAATYRHAVRHCQGSDGTR